MLCSGFVQISQKIVVGATLFKPSSYEGSQFIMPLLIWKVMPTAYSSLIIGIQGKYAAETLRDLPLNLDTRQMFKRHLRDRLSHGISTRLMRIR